MTRGPAPAVESPMADAQVIDRVLGGDRELYQVLVRRHQASLFRIAYSMVLDRDVAADLVQDAFVRAYVNLARCRDRERFRSWLVTILRHRALDHAKERRRRDVSLSDAAVVQQADIYAATPAEAERYPLRTALEGALGRLSEPLREAFVLRHIEQYSTEEVAALLGIRLSAVKMRLQRARASLRDWLDPDVRDTAADVTGGGPGSSEE